ncbi:MAG: NAD-dependent epimerase/dehydratase family protein [Bacteroidia bacterium]|nr:NAD-dependent epimerase/dehydratase family protein [Bacteroidia bacterium]
MQTILGANGVIANNLLKSLPAYTDKIRVVSRNPKKVNPTDQLFSADLLNAEQTDKAVAGSKVAYLTAGLPYTTKVWREQWPVVMNNVIAACKKHNSKLVFFSNVYPYGKVSGWMTEETPFNPCSKKGEVRAKIEEKLLAEMKSGNLQAMIVRGADFYGPNTPLSFVDALLFKNFAAGKKGQWMLNDHTLHSFTYTPDAGKALAILGNAESAFNQVWHAPTDKNVLSGKQFIELAAKEFGVKPDYMILKKWMVRMAGLFDSNIREAVEMLYQSEVDYLFDSSKFEKAFNFTPTTYSQGLVETVKAAKSA